MRDELHPDHCGDRPINQPDAVLALLAGRRQAVEQADPHQVAGAFGKAVQGVAWRHRRQPRPARGQRERGGEQALCRLARDILQAPDRQRQKQHGRQRVAPEADQRVHCARPLELSISPTWLPVSLNFTNKW